MKNFCTMPKKNQLAQGAKGVSLRGPHASEKENCSDGEKSPQTDRFRENLRQARKERPVTAVRKRLDRGRGIRLKGTVNLQKKKKGLDA